MGKVIDDYKINELSRIWIKLSKELGLI